MRRLPLFTVAATAVFLGTAMAGRVADARPLPNGGVTADEVAEVMKIMKLPVEQTRDKQGDPLIKSSSDGRRFGVYFYQCKANRCTSIQFSSGFNDAVPVAKVMEWNRTKRFGRAYIDGTTLYVEMDMDVERGATTEALANNFERWAAVLEQFPKFFQ